MSDDKQPLIEEKNLRQITVNYSKSNFHRAIHVDGVIGAVKSDGDIYLELFNEKPSMPKRIVVTLNEDGEVQKQVIDPPPSSTSLDREIEVSLAMSFDVAASLAERLLELLDLAAEDDEDGEYDEDENTDTE